MRSLTPVFFLLLAVLLVAPTGDAEASAQAGSARVSEADSGPCARGAVRAEGKVVWCGARHRHRLASHVVWSSDRDALAFAARGARGRLTLWVVFVDGMGEGTVLSWPVTLPERQRTAQVTWLGDNRVGLGRSPVRPDLVASWQLRRI